jgi:histidinol-phosphate/aromatic aminotransferase/cobyric acid decarboxylase-like protein
METLYGLDHHGRVVYLGSFSKTMLPTLRLGFAVVPPGLVGAVRKAKHVLDWHSPLTNQAACDSRIPAIAACRRGGQNGAAPPEDRSSGGAAVALCTGVTGRW